MAELTVVADVVEGAGVLPDEAAVHALDAVAVLALSEGAAHDRADPDHTDGGDAEGNPGLEGDSSWGEGGGGGGGEAADGHEQGVEGEVV